MMKLVRAIVPLYKNQDIVASSLNYCQRLVVAVNPCQSTKHCVILFVLPPLPTTIILK